MDFSTDYTAQQNSEISIMDDTLREGEQTPEVRFTTESRMKIFQKLIDTGIKLLNIGSPSVSHNVDGIKKIVALGYTDVELVGHCGCSEKEVDATVDCGLNSIKIYMPTTKEHLFAKFGDKFDNLDDLRRFCLNTVDETITYAKERGIKTISYTAEDMTSTMSSADETEFAYRVIKRAFDNGASRVSLPDTRGIAKPPQVERMIVNFRRNFSGYNVKIEGHFHDDRGLATANSLAAIEAGAKIIHTTVNGMGERSGITPLEQLATNLYLDGIKTGLKYDKIYELCKLVEDLSGFSIARNAPIAGENAFSHDSGRHQQAVVKNPMTYQAIAPKVFGRDATLSLGALTGREGLKGFIRACGVDTENIDNSKIYDILDRIRKYHVQNGVSSPLVAKEIIQTKLGITIDLPKSYSDRAFNEAYLLIKTQAGREENLIKADLMETLKHMSYVAEVTETFGSPSIDYVAKLKYSMNNTKILNQTKSRLANIKGISSIVILNAGDAYKR